MGWSPGTEILKIPWRESFRFSSRRDLSKDAKDGAEFFRGALRLFVNSVTLKALTEPRCFGDGEARLNR